MFGKRWMWALGCLGSIGSSCAGKPPDPLPPRAAPEPEVWPALDEAFVATHAATLGFRLGRPQPLAVAPDEAVFFRRTGARSLQADLFVLETGGESRPIATVEALLAGADERLSDAERARRERSRTATSGIVDIELSKDGRRLLIPLGERVFVLDRASGRSHEVDVGEGYPFDPHLSPDGTRVSFVRDGDVWTTSAEPGASAPRRLTQHPEGVEYGVAEFVAQEEFDRRRGYHWSPDGRWLVFQRTDARPVDTLYVSDPSRPERAPVPFKYPRAGTDNAIVDLGVIAAEGGAPRWLRWDLERYPYLAHVEWPDRGPLCLLVLDRDQTELLLLAADVESGDVRELLRVRDAAWVNVPRGVPAWLPDGSGFLWLNEQEPGFALELRDPAGAKVREIQPATFGIRTVVGVAPDGESAVVLASADPREQHVFRVPLDGAAAQALTTSGGVHDAIAEHGVVVISSSLRGGGAEVRTVAADGGGHVLPDVSERAPWTPGTQLESVELDGRTHYVAVTRPRRFTPGRTYPVLLKVYAGPNSQMVLDTRDAYLLDQWYADAGFIVVRIDGRGTPHRGRSWERALVRDLIRVPLADQVAGLAALARRHPELDRDRVGVFGWSFGGYFSVLALQLRPDVFRAAIAGAPVTDWKLYDTAYTERYMKQPADNPEGYVRTSALTHASKLERPLLLMHGLTDDNVYFAHTLALIEALYRAGKLAEVVALSSTHMLVDPALSLAREKLQVEFFRKHLPAAAR